MKTLIISVAIVFAAGTVAAQDIYKWKDEAGQWHFSHTPPPSARAEQVNLPTPEQVEVKSREEWRRTYAAFLDRPGSRIKNLTDFLSFSIRLCHLSEGVAAAASAVKREAQADEQMDSARRCAREAESTFPHLLSRAQAEMDSRRPASAPKLRELGTTWLAFIRRVPRAEDVRTLVRAQQQERESLSNRQADLDMDLISAEWSK